ncbi:hypothetical protein TNCT_140731 [Trichonephila clavata]|uniref:Uncharacterized protein n=1 Tax=Trichonephila clavata TaxID=2740835 RepID=A0A8X6EYI7_TRICU|nr:hypothetical protein TNCT_140731 [Trichonephila clavata]
MKNDLWDRRNRKPDKESAPSRTRVIGSTQPCLAVVSTFGSDNEMDLHEVRLIYYALYGCRNFGEAPKWIFFTEEEKSVASQPLANCAICFITRFSIRRQEYEREN